MNQSAVRRAEENSRQARAVEMGAQGAWTTWETADRKLTWGDIWKYELFGFPFFSGLSMIYFQPQRTCADWGLTEDPKCRLYDRVAP
ncbi:hypothetical protein DPMN_027600 [Dreissena polymorpha]|uniref:Uncharacterized protein n=1 Tax=Dreissena polymorpha TaxID=45954 RepID=A0A9D4LXC5_DREPO|nr:hypothetical protein DPMN_097669 [Dreissena polymorpha]KAH3864482.1 hypothetical protein DPMN_027500 [Dreissena polymorpha]KAH3864581.1 hypothetical protein DPMN_027600 [Dreissena polymorpha]